MKAGPGCGQTQAHLWGPHLRGDGMEAVKLSPPRGSVGRVVSTARSTGPVTCWEPTAGRNGHVHVALHSWAHAPPVLPKPPLLAPSLPGTLLPPDLPSGFAGSCAPCQPGAAGPAESHLSPCAPDAPGGILCQGLRPVFVPNPEPPRPCTRGSELGTALGTLQSAQGRAGPDTGVESSASLSGWTRGTPPLDLAGLPDHLGQGSCPQPWGRQADQGRDCRVLRTRPGPSPARSRGRSVHVPGRAHAARGPGRCRPGSGVDTQAQEGRTLSPRGARGGGSEWRERGGAARPWGAAEGTNAHGPPLGSGARGHRPAEPGLSRAQALRRSCGKVLYAEPLGSPALAPGPVPHSSPRPAPQSSPSPRLYSAPAPPLVPTPCRPLPSALPGVTGPGVCPAGLTSPTLGTSTHRSSGRDAEAQRLSRPRARS